MKRSGLLLIFCGVVGLAFFLLTDPKMFPARIGPMGWRDNLVDAVQDAQYGTAIGLAGSAVILGIGLWLVLRRSV